MLVADVKQQDFVDLFIMSCYGSCRCKTTGLCCVIVSYPVMLVVNVKQQDFVALLYHILLC